MANQVLNYGDILITSYELVRLHELEVVKSVNDHAYLRFSGVIHEEKKDSYVNQTTAQTPVKVLLKDKETGKDEMLFSGFVLDVEVKAVRGIYYIEVKAVSYTYLLDVKRNKRSFQNPKLTYSGLVDAVISHYSKADCIDAASQGQAIQTIVMQYEETDWQFLKRIASRFYTVLVAAAEMSAPCFFLGLPEGQDKGKLVAKHYTAKKRVSEYQYAVENDVPGIDDQDYTVYEVESERLLVPGNEVLFKARKLVVGRAVSCMKNSILTHTYQLFPRKGLRQKKEYNQAIIGASIQATVVKINKDTVRAKLDMDDQEDPNTDYWFPYSTIYASEGNTGWYCMPEENDNIRIYFPSSKEEEGYAISSVKRGAASDAKSSGSSSGSAGASGSTGAGAALRAVVPVAASGGAKDDGSDWMSNSDRKSFRTKYGKEIVLEPHQIVIQAAGMAIVISDAQGIQITSDQNISINAGGSMMMKAKNIQLSAGKIELSGKANTITLGDSLVKVDGEEIKMN
ncbi:contractile injection system protein, VgrG/Pvc8 family [Paenibacillus algorifonticola]|uniref:contractile injection system protein, VgrG/Pvc8 family n=1 Tax=Paenibacillus algorifonticola TaxID=684063 RepID=UPI003D270E38